MRLDEIAMREDGVDREVISIKPAAQPLQVAILIDTSDSSRVKDAYGTPEEYIQDVRTSIGSFVRQLFSRSPDVSAEMMEFGQAAVPVTPFTSNPADLLKGVTTVVPKRGSPSVLMEALAQANKDLAKRPSRRRAIVTLNLEPSDEQSREDPKSVLQAFRTSGAQLWSVSLHRGQLRNSKRDVILNELAKTSGGRREFIVGVSAVETLLKNYADALAAQYEVTYIRPESKKAPVQVQIGTVRQNVKLHASGFAPE
jgi:hypothetical protein